MYIKIKFSFIHNLFIHFRFIKIDGRTNAEHRKYQIDEFQNCNDCIAAILSITAANAGITLTAAKLVVFAELFWNPGVFIIYFIEIILFEIIIV